MIYHNHKFPIEKRNHHKIQIYRIEKIIITMKTQER